MVTCGIVGTTHPTIAWHEAVPVDETRHSKHAAHFISMQAEPRTVVDAPIVVGTGTATVVTGTATVVHPTIAWHKAVPVAET